MPRDAREILGRLMALRAVLWRTQFELHLSQQGAPRGDIESRHKDLTRWMRAATIPFSPREQALLDRSLGAWAHDEIGEYVWRNEAAAMLLWSIELVPTIPPFTMPIPAAAVMERIEALPQLAVTGDAPPMRPDTELARARELAGLWNWRARTEGFRLAGTQPPEGDSYDGTISRATEAALAAKLVGSREVLDGDLVVAANTRYAAAPTEVLRQLACIAHERHWALSWIADPTSAWDSVNPPT